MVIILPLPRTPCQSAAASGKGTIRLVSHEAAGPARAIDLGWSSFATGRAFYVYSKWGTNTDPDLLEAGLLQTLSGRLDGVESYSHRQRAARCDLWIQDVRVGDAFTKERKSSALLRERLVDMILAGYVKRGSTAMVTAAGAQMRAGLCGRVLVIIMEARTASRLGIGQGVRLVGVVV